MAGVGKKRTQLAKPKELVQPQSILMQNMTLVMNGAFPVAQIKSKMILISNSQIHLAMTQKARSLVMRRLTKNLKRFQRHLIISRDLIEF